jgi:hypothetical protein
MNTGETQNERILRFMQSGLHLTPHEALYRFGCMRLAARIAELRKQGHAIKSDRRKTSNGAHHAIYWIEDNGAT